MNRPGEPRSESIQKRWAKPGISSIVAQMNLEEVSDERGAVIRLEGEADLAAVPLFQEAMRAKASAAEPRLVVDFSGVTFVNTPIWAVLVEYYQATTENGTSFAVAGLQPRVAASYDIVRLGDFIPAFETVDEALDSLTAAS